MADSNASALTALALADVAAGDLLYIVDVSETGIAKAKKITVASLFGDGTNRTVLTDSSGRIIIRQPGGVAGTDELQIGHDGTHTIYTNKDGTTARHQFRQGTGGAGDRAHVEAESFYVGTNGAVLLNSSGVRVVSGQGIGFTASAITDLASPGDIVAGFNMETTSVVKVRGPSAGAAWLQQTAGRSRVASDVTNATTTMANVTGLSATLIAGRKYTGKLVLYVNDSVAADGIKVDFDGGTATMTGFRAHATIFDSALLLSSQTSAIATDFVVATVTGDAIVEIDFGFVCNAAGTFIPRAAQNAHTTGTLTVYANSHLWLEDMP